MNDLIRRWDDNVPVLSVHYLDVTSSYSDEDIRHWNVDETIVNEYVIRVMTQFLSYTSVKRQQKAISQRTMHVASILEAMLKAYEMQQCGSKQCRTD